MTSYLRCHCIITQVGRLTAWLEQHQGADQALLAVDTHDMFAYMLLHEIGHIVHGDPIGQNESSNATSNANRFNLDPTAQKAREIAADRYAADAISAAIAERGTERSIAARAVALTLAQLSWKLAEHRLVDSFGGTALKEQSLF
jgi:hypothetical protein